MWNAFVNVQLLHNQNVQLGNATTTTTTKTATTITTRTTTFFSPACPAGLFGHNCAKMCHCKDRTEKCDSILGMCKSGCDKGWTGFDCQTRESSSFFFFFLFFFSLFFFFSARFVLFYHFTIVYRYTFFFAQGWKSLLSLSFEFFQFALM